MAIPELTESGYQPHETPRNQLPLLFEAQDNVQSYYNLAMIAFRHILQGFANSIGDTTPPGSPSIGDVYILGASPTGVWLGHAQEIAIYENDMLGFSDGPGWLYWTPKDGMWFWVEDIAAFRRYNQATATWVAGPS